MKLPDNDQAIIDTQKLENYLLSLAHPIGRAKAEFFRSIGFNINNTAVFKEALLRIAGTGKVNNTISTAHGVKYVVDGRIKAPSGKEIALRTIWITEAGAKHPRFVTAYPFKFQGGDK